MGGKGSGKRKVTRTTTTETVGDEGEGGERSASSVALTASPIFADRQLDETETTFDHVRIQRLGPVPEGTLGNIQPDEGTDEIYRQWGGGKYKATACTENGRPIKGGIKTFEIAGEPRFKTKAAAIEYRRMVGDDGEGKKQGADVVEIMLRQEELRRQEWERRQQEAEKTHQREIERLRLEAQLREKERIADDERRERERRLDDERRRREEDERERRRQKDAEEARRRDQEFYAAMRKQGDGANPIETMMAGINLALKLKGDGGDEHPFVEFGKMLPGILEKGAGLVKAGAAAVAQQPANAPAANGAGAVAPSTQVASANGVAPGAGAPVPKKPKVVLEGEIAERAKAAILHLQSIGVSPEQALAAMFDQAQRLGKVPDIAAAPPPAPAVAPSSAPVPAPPRADAPPPEGGAELPAA